MTPRRQPSRHTVSAALTALAATAATAATALALATTACNQSAETTTRADASTTASINAAGGSPAATAAATTVAKAPDTTSASFDRSRILGDSTARVWFIMISDFQCPYCKQFHDESFESLRKEYVATGRMRMAYINFPLPMHQNAWPAAEAAMCAGAQGKFWPMHDLLFNTQTVWEEKQHAVPVLDSLASSAGVDTVALDACVSKHLAKALIDADIVRAEHAGARSTPTIVIGNKIFIGVQPIANYRRAIDSALAAAK